jgi:uncharacterized membrane protein
MAGLVLMYGMCTGLCFGFYLIGDRNLDFWSASRESFAMVRDSFFPFLGLVVVAALAAHAGLLLCGIGIIFTAPFFFCVTAVAYRDTLAQMASEVAVDAEPVPAEENASDDPGTPPSV